MKTQWCRQTQNYPAGACKGFLHKLAGSSNHFRYVGLTCMKNKLLTSNIVQGTQNGDHKIQEAYNI